MADTAAACRVCGGELVAHCKHRRCTWTRCRSCALTFPPADELRVAPATIAGPTARRCGGMPGKRACGRQLVRLVTYTGGQFLICLHCDVGARAPARRGKVE